MGKKHISIALLVSIFGLLFYSVLAQTKDTTIRVVHDSTIKVQHDSTFKIAVTPTQPDYIAAHYLNNIASWMYSASMQDAVIKWCLDNKQNAVEIYGVDGAITSTSNWKWISRFNDSCSAHNILTAFIWSKATSVTVDLDKFQKAQTRPTAKFDYVKNESEPYNNTVSYQLWWQYSRQVVNYAHANGMISAVYVGWHTQASYDSIRSGLYDQVDIHVYLQPSAMSNPASVYGYMGPRLVMLCNKPGNFNFGMINSDETAFAYSYYATTKDFESPVPTFKTGFNNGAPAKVKAQAKFTKHETFVASYSWQIKPLPTSAVARMAFEPSPYRTVLYVSEKTGKVNFLKAKTLSQIKREYPAIK